jgi:predicted esterase
MDDQKILDPHHGAATYFYGKPLEQAASVMILLHGRGATAREVLFLAELLDLPDFAYIAPQANNNSWYPYRFTATFEQNEPWLTSAISLIKHLVSEIENSGFSTDNIVLGGFSQGACLAAEYAVRNARRYGGLLIFSGGLIGPPGTVWEYPGSLQGTPTFFGCSDRDPHIPLDRVLKSSRVLEEMGADLACKIYPNLAHTVHPDEIQRAREMLNSSANK